MTISEENEVLNKIDARSDALIAGLNACRQKLKSECKSAIITGFRPSEHTVTCSMIGELEHKNCSQLPLTCTRSIPAAAQVNALAIVRDSQDEELFLVAACADSTLRLWSLNDVNVFHQVSECAELLSSLDSKLASAETAAVVKVWTVRKSQLECTQVLPTVDSPTALGLFNNLLAIGLCNGTLQIWEGDKLKSSRVNAHAKRINALARVSSLIVSCSANNDIKLWSMDLAECKCTLSRPSMFQVNALCVLGDEFFASSSFKEIMVWRIIANEVPSLEQHLTTAHTDGILAISSLDSDSFVTGSGDKTLKVWQRDSSAANFEEAATLTWTNSSGVRAQCAIKLAPSKFLVASVGSRETTIKIWS